MSPPDPVAAIRLSLLVACASVLVTAPLAVLLGRWLARGGGLPGRSFVGALLLVPLVLPPTVTGLLLLRLFGREGLGPLLESVGLHVAFAPLGAVVAGVVVSLPLFVLSARAAFEAIDPAYEEVSRSLGVPPGRTFLRVGLPLALPGLLGGAVLAFARALGEFGATAVLAANTEGQTRTIALAVYTLLESPDGAPGLRVLVGASVALSLAAIVGAEALARWQRRRLELPRG